MFYFHVFMVLNTVQDATTLEPLFHWLIQTGKETRWQGQISVLPLCISLCAQMSGSLYYNKGDGLVGRSFLRKTIANSLTSCLAFYTIHWKFCNTVYLGHLFKETLTTAIIGFNYSKKLHHCSTSVEISHLLYES